MNKRTYIAIGILLVLFVLVAINVKISRQYPQDWTETFNEKSKMPYGLLVFKEELAKLFENQNFRMVYYQPESYLYANSENGYGDFVAQGSYLKIGNTDNFTEASIHELLDFVSNGNTLFLSDYDIPSILSDTLGVEIASMEGRTDSTAIQGFYDQRFKLLDVQMNRMTGAFFFSNYDPNQTEVLGYVDLDEEQPNFIRIPFEEGAILLHLEPKVFTNYHMLKEERYTYVEALVSYLPDNDLYFDSYLKYTRPYGVDPDSNSNLGWFLQQPAFRWAWYAALILALLFVIFTARRKQRIIPIIKPLENTTVGFVKTISNVYLEAEDHKNMVDKKIRYFLEHLRNTYNVDTSKLDENFIQLLCLKSGAKKEGVTKLIEYINYLNEKETLLDIHLVRLNSFIEEFYTP